VFEVGLPAKLCKSAMGPANARTSAIFYEAEVLPSRQKIAAVIASEAAPQTSEVVGNKAAWEQHRLGEAASLYDSSPILAQF
jgi:hypothetical protein